MRTFTMKPELWKGNVNYGHFNMSGHSDAASDEEDNVITQLVITQLVITQLVLTRQPVGNAKHNSKLTSRI